jgi:hypothetical protein
MSLETMIFENHEFKKGVDLFNRARFFDAHEILEDVWRSSPRDRPLRRHLQGLVQLAVAFHHVSKGNYLGAKSVLERALRNLAGADASFPDLDLIRLRAELSLWQPHLNDFAEPSKHGGAVRPEIRSEIRPTIRPARPADPPPLPKILPRHSITSSSPH